MQSVMQRIKSIKQPRGGYVHPSWFKTQERKDGVSLHMEETVNAGLVGIAVDYLTRVGIGETPFDAFKVSRLGASFIQEDEYAEELVNRITGLDQVSIQAACELAGFDVCYRVGRQAYREVREISADWQTIDNIRVMVERSTQILKEFGPITANGFTVDGGRGLHIAKGDGDYLTRDTLWECKVLKSKLTAPYTLQLLVYYLMGKRSGQPEFQTIKNLGVFNPRLHTVSLLEVAAIPVEVVRQVETEVIGY